jgi:hypothetical protein
MIHVRPIWQTMYVIRLFGWAERFASSVQSAVMQYQVYRISSKLLYDFRAKTSTARSLYWQAWPLRPSFESGPCIVVPDPSLRANNQEDNGKDKSFCGSSLSANTDYGSLWSCLLGRADTKRHLSKSRHMKTSASVCTSVRDTRCATSPLQFRIIKCKAIPVTGLGGL